MKKFQNIMLFRFCRFEQEPFINDQQYGGGILSLYLLIGAVITCHFQIKKQVGEKDIFGLKTLLACFHAKCTGHICLSASGGTGIEKIQVFCDILTGSQPLNQ